MKHLTRLITTALFASFLGGIAPAYAAATNAGENLCSADAPFKSRVDEKLNSLPFEELQAVADKGNIDAKVLLGLRHTMSDHLDYDKAAALFRAAAQKKNADGEYYLAVAYMNGLGVQKDEAQAVVWFRRSAAHGHDVAKYWVGEMTAKGRGGLKADWNAALPYFKAAAAGAVGNAIVEIGIMYHEGLGGLPQDFEKAATCYRIAMRHGSTLAQENLTRMIARGETPMLPGEEPKAKPAATVEPKP